MSSRCLGLFIVLSLLVASGCAPPEVKKKRFFFPPPPNEAKIEYIGFYQSDHDLSDQVDWLEDAIFGRVKPYALFKDPYDVAADASGRVFVTDLGKRQVLVLDLINGKVRFLGQKQVSYGIPFALAVDANGITGVTDLNGHRVYLFDSNENLFSTVLLERNIHPAGLALNAQKKEVLVSDTRHHQIAVYDYNGNFLRTIGERGEEIGQFNYPVDLTVGPDGNVYVLDAMNFRVQVLGEEDKVLRVFGEQGTALGSFKIPKGIAVTPSGQVYVTDAIAHRIVVFDLAGNHLMTLGGKKSFRGSYVIPGGFYLPKGVAAGQDDSVWVVDSLNRTLHHFQYLNDRYLEAHPVEAGDVFYPKQ